MKTLLLFSLLICASAYADLKPGTYTEIDRYGLPPAPDENAQDVKKYSEYLSQTKKGGTLKIANLDPIDLINPGWWLNGKQIQNLPLVNPYVFENLMFADIRGHWRTLHAGIVKSVTLQPDGKTFTADLREDVRFSDGSLLTANDIVYSWKEFTETLMGDIQANTWKDRTGKVELKALNAHQIQFQFDVPQAKLRDALWYFIAACPVLKENKTTSNKITIPNHYLGTGPYVVDSAGRDGAKLLRRQDYWDKNIKLYNFDQVEIQSFRDITVVRESFTGGRSINFYEEERKQNEETIDAKLKDGIYDKHELVQPGQEILTGLLYMNMAKGPTKDLNFRKAIALMYDADSIFRDLFAGTYSRMPDLLWESDFHPKGEPNAAVKALFAGDPIEKQLNQPYETLGTYAINQPASYRDRVRQAMSLLKEIGYTVVNQKLMKDGAPVVIDATYRLNSPEAKAFERLRTDVARIGVELALHPKPDSATFVATIDGNDYNLAWIRLDTPRKMDVMDLDTLRFRYSSGSAVATKGSNNSNVCNMQSPLMDSLISKMELADPASQEFRDLQDAALRYISANVPFIMTGEKTTKSLYAQKGLCLAPIATDRVLESAYMSPTGKCP